MLILVIVTLVCFSLSCEKYDSLYDLNGVTFTKILAETYPEYKLDGNIVNYNEIFGYDSTKHIFLLSDNAGERIRKENYPVSPTRFAVAVNGELIYIANFIPGYSSASCFDCITVEPYSYDNKYRVLLGYPTSDFFSGIYPRNDTRIISRLKKDKKLFDID
jgi:hypothetical protein